MRFLIPAILFLILAGCKSKEQTAAVVEPPSPTWVSSRPISGSYYVGIGVAPKSAGTNYQRAAKENALSDLASEIKVNVNTNSLLYTLEREYKFEQEFRETIRTSSNLDLEDFEAVDNWEDSKSYWVYYRLDKNAYAEKLRQQKNTAQELGIDFLSKAEAAENSGRYSAAADFYLRGLQAIEKFINEENRVDYQGQSILLDNTLFTGLKSLLSNQRIVVDNALELTFRNGFTNNALVRVTSIDGVPQEAVPLISEYFGAYGRRRSKSLTNADGRTEILITETDKERPDNSLLVSVDTERIFEPFQSDKFMRSLTKSLRGAELSVPIKYIAPSIFINSSEKNLGNTLDGQPLTAAIMTSLGRRGVRFTGDKKDADLIMEIKATTEQGGTAQGFSTSLLNVDIVVIDNLSKETKYKVSKPNIKGVDLDFEKAGVKAYQNLTRNIESELMRTLVNDLL